MTKQDVELLGQDIRFIKETAEFSTSDKVIYQRWYYLSLYFVTILGVVMSWFYARRQERLRSDIVLARRKKAGRMASKRLAKAKKYLKPDNQHDFYREIALALDITERSVIRIIKDLEKDGYVTKRKEGRENRYTVNKDLPLRRIDQREVHVRELLNLISTKKENFR